MNQRRTDLIRSLRRLSLTGLTLATFSLGHAALNIPDTPLQTGTSADPNVMMILDDSGSMHFEIMPDEYTLTAQGQWVWVNNVGWVWAGGTAYYVFPRADNVYGPSDYTNAVVTVDWNNPYARLARSPQINSVYYNPSVTYTPWSPNGTQVFGPASTTCALHNPMRSGVGAAFCRNLTVNNTNFNGNSWIRCTAANNCNFDTNNRNFWPATYFRYNGGGIWNINNYTQVTIQPATATYSGEGRDKRTDCTNGTCTYNQEIQNFANWYTYYRSRVLTARAGIGKAFFSQGTGLRVGFGAINKASTAVDGANWRTIISGVRQFSGTDRNNFFNNLYSHNIPAQGTPLRRALDDAGQYYSWNDDRGPWSSTPGAAGGTNLACRQSYTILMTDGYWNGDGANTATGNQDNSNGPLHTGPNGQSGRFISESPFTDGYSDTLADVAAYYWKNDLSPGPTGLVNAVPTTTRDPAFWQHMVTFGVGLGVRGSVDPDTAFNAIGNPAQNVTWPNNPADSDTAISNPGKIDDLLHAAVNSRGAFFSAQNPVEFADALTDMLNDIVNRKSSSASVATNSTKLTTSSLVFGANFNTNKWTGELEAYAVTDSGVATHPTWKASEKIPAHNLRKIFTTSGSAAKEFLWSNLSPTDQTALVSSDVLAFIRGDRSKEVQNGGTMRNRGSLLGDIVHSSPNYSKDSKLVLVGANDGMLHGFSADTGVELFAYIPSAMLGKLEQLSQTTYGHKFFVDGDIAIGEKSQTFLNKTYAVATLGRGGKGLFALDITTPASFGTGNVAWEYVSTTDKDLGYMLGKPVIAQMNDDTTVAIVGNGYNSTDGKAVLYIINLETGAVRTISTGVAGDNGLATPGAYDANADGYVDYIYAGDLKGNVWKFDVTSSNANQWKVAHNGAPMFVAKDAAGNLQPITSQITMAKNYLRTDPNVGKLFLFFGTGAYFRNGDPTDKAVQSWYAIIDEGTTIAGRNFLKPRGLNSVFTVEGKTVRSFKPAVIQFDTNGNVISHDMASWKGWYIDWLTPPANTAQGERITTPSAFYRFTEPVLLVSSNVPVADDPCQPGGTGYLNAINAFTGGSLSESFFLFSSYSGSTAIGSLDMDIGMVSQAAIFTGDSSTGQLVVGGSGKTNSQDGATMGYQRVNTGVQPRGRLSWREIIRD